MKVKRVKQHIELSLNKVEAHQLRALMLHLSAGGTDFSTFVSGDTLAFTQALYEKVALATDRMTGVDYGAIREEVK